MSSVLRGFIPIVLLTAVSLNVVLAIQLGEARRDSRRAELRQHVANVDEYVPAYIAEALDGQRIDVGRPASGHRQVIIAYRSTCGHCNAAVPGWRELAQKLSSYSTVGMSPAVCLMQNPPHDPNFGCCVCWNDM